MTREESTGSKAAPVYQLAACILLKLLPCASSSVAVFDAVSALLTPCRFYLLFCCVCVAFCRGYSSSYFCVYLVLPVYQAGSAQLDFDLITDRCNCDIHVD